MTQVLSSPALVLNRNWVAIATITVRKAMTLLYRGAAQAVCPETFQVHDFESWSELSVIEGQQHIKTVTLEIRVPEVILLTVYGRVPPREVVFSRRNLYRRDTYSCQYCGAMPGTQELTIDHVLPRSRGGRTVWSNCVLACVPCNARKRNRTPKEAGMRLLGVPVKPDWNPRLVLKVGHIRESWEQFISRKYWDVELKD